MARFLSLLLIGGTAFLLGCGNSEESRATLSPAPLLSASPPIPLASPSPGKLVQAKQIDKTWSTKFDFETQSIKSAHNGIRSYEIDVDYPQIKNRTPHAVKFNRWIRKKVRGYVNEFERLERNAEKSDRRKNLPPAHITEALKIWFLVYYSDEHLVSLRLTHSVMALGQMHPVDYYETINYDLQRGRQLESHEIFKRGYLRAFSSYCRRFIPENYEMSGIPGEWLKEGTEAKRNNFPNWNIVPDGILIAFEDYQIGPHSFGQLELIIPYSELKTVLKANAFTAKFVTT